MKIKLQMKKKNDDHLDCFNTINHNCNVLYLNWLKDLFPIRNEALMIALNLPVSNE